MTICDCQEWKQPLRRKAKKTFEMSWLALKNAIINIYALFVYINIFMALNHVELWSIETREKLM